MQPAQPLDEAFIREVFMQFKNKITKIGFGGYIPNTVIGYADKLRYNHLIWRSERQVKRLLFNKATKILSGEYAVPGLVWSFGSSLDMYAYKKWQGEETVLYWPPFYNCTQDSVCLGTAADYIDQSEKQYTFKDLIYTIENAFWNSCFTHAGSTDNIIGNFSAMYAKTLNQKEFLNDYLVSADKTVKELTNEIFKA